MTKYNKKEIRNQRLVIIGAGGHGKVIADIAERNGYREIVFLDDDKAVTECAGYPVIGESGDVGEMDADVILGIGDGKVRRRIQDSLKNVNFVTLVHPDAVVARDVILGEGTVVMAGAVINPGTEIGRGCIINTCASVDHDCKVGDFVHVAVGSHLCGMVRIENEVWIGAGATVSNNLFICQDCVIGAGAVVVKDIVEKGTYVGMPARKIEMKQKNTNRGGVKPSSIKKKKIVFCFYAA